MAKKKPAIRKTAKRTTKPKKAAKETKGAGRTTAAAKLVAKAGSKKRRVPKRVLDYIRAKRAYNRYGKELKKLPGVNGLSIGPRFKDGDFKREIVLRLHVATEADKAYLKEHAEELGYKKLYGGVNTDIVHWNFTATAGTPLPDGACISGGGGDGTSGTTVIIDVDNVPTAVWLTAAHVVEKQIVPPAGPMSISRCSGGKIGETIKAHHFRNKHVDAAYVVPKPALPAPVPTSRTIPPLTGADLLKPVTMAGAQTQGKGKIVSLDYDGPVKSPVGKEPVVDHFLVKGDSGNFAVGGDSGAIVFKGKQLLGMMRASDEEKHIGVATRMDIVRSKTKLNGRGFIL